MMLGEGGSFELEGSNLPALCQDDDAAEVDMAALEDVGAEEIAIEDEKADEDDDDDKKSQASS